MYFDSMYFDDAMRSAYSIQAIFVKQIKHNEIYETQIEKCQNISPLSLPQEQKKNERKREKDEAIISEM